MSAQGPQAPSNPAPERPSSDSAQGSPERPWRTEGLPKKQPPKQRPRWIVTAIWLVGYLVWFGVVTIQDRLSGPQTVPYTEFKSQVASKNVAELFARAGALLQR